MSLFQKKIISLSVLLSLSALCSEEQINHKSLSMPRGQVVDNSQHVVQNNSEQDFTPIIMKNFTKEERLNHIKEGVVTIEVVSHRGDDARHLGTGFIVDKENGIILTNAHVAGGVGVYTYAVTLSDGTKAKGAVIKEWGHPCFDFAFLRVDPKSLSDSVKALPFAKSSVEINEALYTVGNSEGMAFSPFKLTAYDVHVNTGPFHDQSIGFTGFNRGGSSGSPVVNNTGEVVAILYGGSEAAGVALPIQYVENALRDIQNGTQPTYKTTGIIPTYGDIDELLNGNMITPEAHVLYLEKFSNCQNKILTIRSRLFGTSGYEVTHNGDVLWSYQTQAMKEPKLIGPHLQEFDRVINQLKIDEPIKIQLFRHGKLITVNLKIEKIDTSAFEKTLFFGSALFSERVPLYYLMKGETASEGVYIHYMRSESSFRKIMGNFPGGYCANKIISINGVPIKTLEDMKTIVPQLLTKDSFVLQYIPLSGYDIGFNGYVLDDSQPRVMVIQHTPQYQMAYYDQKDPETKEWVREILQPALSSPKLSFLKA